MNNEQGKVAFILSLFLFLLMGFLLLPNNTHHHMTIWLFCHVVLQLLVKVLKKKKKKKINAKCCPTLKRAVYSKQNGVRA